MTEHIKTVSSPELLAAAQQTYHRAKRERLTYIQYMNKHKSLLKAQGGKVEQTDEYHALLLKEQVALAQLEAIRNTQYKNVFIESNAAKGLSQ